MAGQKKFNFDAAPDAATDLPHQLRHLVRCGDMEIVKFDKLEECIAHIKSIGKEKMESSTPRSDDIDVKDCMASGDGGSAKIRTTTCPIATSTRSTARRPIQIIGVEIDETARDLEGEPFEGDTAFMMGNEGQGMNEKQMSLCDGFVRIAQYGGGTASLNVSVGASIVLHRFHHWARGDANVRRYCDDAKEGGGEGGKPEAETGGNMQIGDMSKG